MAIGRYVIYQLFERPADEYLAISTERITTMYSTSTLVAPNDTSLALASLFTSRPAAGLEVETNVLRRWALEYLSKSHPDLGRKGAVCPFTSPSIKKDLFWVSFLKGAELERDAISGALTEVIRQFQSSEPVEEKDEMLKTVILVFPDLEDYSIVDEIQLEFKNMFIKYGLMVGQFYPGCGEGGLWNQHFRPLDAPYPMIAIRTMTASDYPFLTGSEEWASAYLSRFAPGIPARVRNDMVQRIVAGGVPA